jgi:hypothetical protein
MREQRIGKDVAESFEGEFQVKSRYLPGWIEENHELRLTDTNQEC